MSRVNDLPTKEALLRVTMEQLLREDESELRVLDICEQTQLSTSVIYGHFHSRQGLIDAALLRIYEEVTDSLIEQLESAAASVDVDGSFVDALYFHLVDPRQEHVVTRNRQMHLRISASALARPSLRQGFLALYAAYNRRSDPIFAGLIARGYLSDRLSARQWAYFFEGQMLSRALHDIETGWNVQSDWRDTARLFVAGDQRREFNDA